MNSTPSHEIISGRMVWLDCLRLIAGVSIVGLHASSDINGQPFPDFEIAERVGPVLFRAVIYIARTELFLMISLFLLCMSLDRRPRGYAETIVEQARRLLVPFLFWAVFYAFYRVFKASYLGYESAIWVELATFWQWPRYLLLGSVQYHMHFLPTLFGLVLLFPLYKFAVRNPWLGLLVFLCLFTKREADVWMWANLQDMPGFPYLVRGVKILTYAGYGMVAGSFYGLVKQGMDHRRLSEWFFFALASGVLLFGLKLIYSYKVVHAGDWQYNYTPAFWADFLMPVLLFLACMAAALRRWPAIISQLAPFSFGIYLVHPVFLDGLEVLLWQSGISPTAYVFAKFTGAVVLTAAAVFLLSKSNLLGWTVGLRPLPRVRFGLRRTL
ncbi:MAG: acyltransferase [Rhodobacteraceae bacterium]|nr:acyltransferase [Paracoccaceae bacterium]